MRPDNKKAFWLSAILLVILVGGSVAYCLGYRLDLSKDSTPAWIQAIGSVLAIVAAAWIAKHQNVQARKLEEFKKAKADKQKLEVIIALMSRSHRLSVDVCKAFKSNNQDDINQISPSLMDDTHKTLMALPIFEIPSWQLSLDALMIGRALASLQEQFHALQVSTSERDFQSRLVALNEYATEIRQITDDAVTIAKKHIKRLDAVLGESG